MSSKEIILVTGASSGIGESIVRKFCKNNFQVILTARSSNKLERLNQELINSGYKTYSIPCDLTKENDVKNLYKESNKIGFVCCIINNAGVGRFSKIENVSTTDWDEQINTNLRGSFLVTREFVKDMINKKDGKILFINSVAGKHGYPFSAAYVSSKYGLTGFADSLRNELREYNIKVISIHPGAINTDFWDKTNVEFPKEEMLQPTEISETVFHAVTASESTVLEEIVIRRTAGDF